MKIIFVTHGQTEENAKHIIQGQRIGGQLTALGVAQAREVGERLKDTKIDAAYASDLSRAVQTANEILKFHSGLKLQLAKELRERDYGALSGKTKEEIGWQDDWVLKDMPQFETIGSMCSRIGRFLARIGEQHKDDTVLMVAHRNCGAAVECVANNIPLSEFGSIKEMRNGDMEVFDYGSKSRSSLR